MPVLSLNDSSASPLASLYSQGETDPRLFLVTGSSGTGKTSWCQARAAEAQASGLRVGGFLSPPVFIGEHKTAIDLLDLANGRRRRLAGLRQPGSSAVVVTGKWSFNPDTLAWGNQVLGKLTFVHLLILDELGPLEFLHGKGLQQAFLVLQAGGYQVACVTVRPGLLDEALDRLPGARVLDVRTVKPSRVSSHD